MYMLKKISAKVCDNKSFCILLAYFVCYYIYRLFNIPESYDELYTYIHFIDNGFLYSATHWPLPNNHVFFSMISSLLTVTGSGYIALRGVSFIAGLSTLILLYTFLKNSISTTAGLIGCCSYVSMVLVNEQAVQGRGYSLAIFFMMLSIWNAYKIAASNAKLRNYIAWGIGLWLGLYTLVASIYWVIALCLCFGIILLVYKKKSELIKLIIASIAAAFACLISYGILWCCIGADYIQPILGLNESTFRTIIRHPRSCLLHGFNIMQSNGYMQGIEDRSLYFRDFKYFARSLFDCFVHQQIMNIHIYIFAITLVLFGFFIFFAVKNRQNKLLIPLLLASLGIWSAFIVLTIQCSFPYFRVFTFLGIFFATIVALVAHGLGFFINKLIVEKWIFVFGIPAMLFSFYIVLTPYMTKGYYYLDDFCYEAIASVDLSSKATYMADSEFSYLHMEFVKDDKHLDIAFTTENPDFIILYTEEKNTNMQFPFIISNETVAAVDYSKYDLSYENLCYKVFVRK